MSLFRAMYKCLYIYIRKDMIGVIYDEENVIAIEDVAGTATWIRMGPKIWADSDARSS